MAASIKPDAVRVHTSELTAQIVDPNAPLVRVTLRKAKRTVIDEKSLRDALEPFSEAVAQIDRALATASVTKEDCIEIETKGGTIIRIGCPTITLGEPSIG